MEKAFFLKRRTFNLRCGGAAAMAHWPPRRNPLLYPFSNRRRKRNMREKRAKLRKKREERDNLCENERKTHSQPIYRLVGSCVLGVWVAIHPRLSVP